MDQARRGGRAPMTLAVVVVLVIAGCSGAAETTAASDAEPTVAAVPTPTPDDAEPSPEPSEPVNPVTEAPSPTAPPPDPLQGLASEVIAEGFDQPVLVTGAPGTSLLYVVEREGVVWTVDDGVAADEPFLDLRDQLLSSSIEQGLLGLTFHPDFATNGRFYAYWTDPAGDSRLGEFRAPDPAVADPDSLEVVLEVDQPAERHNAGNLAFGPDGLLYVALGDGGSGGSTAQDTSDLLGSILRLDVDGGDPYAIPAGNPFDDEIWVYGLRNPWRFAIDPVDELVYIADVGQEAFEEVNVVSLDDGAGTNFGWSLMEGDECFRSGCDQQGLEMPVLQYTHDDGCSITGGHVYRGPAIPELIGHYFYADWCTGLVRSFRFDDGEVSDENDWTDELDLGQVNSFGVDNDGELLAANWDGQVFRIVPVR